MFGFAFDFQYYYLPDLTDTMRSHTPTKVGTRTVHSSRDETVSSISTGSDPSHLEKNEKPEIKAGFREYLSQQSIAFFLLGALVSTKSNTIEANI